MAECPTCGKELATESGMKTHHAQVHDERLTQNSWTCAWCEEQFTRPESQVNGNENVFCSKACHGEWIHNNEHTRKRVSCEWCGHVFERRESHIDSRQHNFCSHECHGNWKKQQGTIVVSCEVCDTEVTKNKAYAERCDYHFCSTDCQGAWYSENINGEDHPLWKGGGDVYYGPNWLSQRRATVERDNYECQDCGLTREEHYEQYGSDLEVHHKTPIRTFEDTSDANQLANLITVCMNCHMKREHRDD